MLATHLVDMSGIHGAHIVGCEHLLELLEHHEVFLFELRDQFTTLVLVWRFFELLVIRN